MTMPTTNPSGLTMDEALKLQEQYGKNELTPQKKQSFFHKVLHIISEPMFLLLIAAAVIYFLLGEMRDGAIMLVFVVGIITIDVVQEWKTDKTLHALRDLSAPHINVLRDGVETNIASRDLVPGDLMLIMEGVKIPADGFVLKCADLRVDESTLTGEAEQVWKVPTDSVKETSEHWRNDYCYAGTLCTQGTGSILVDRIGLQTEYGKIGADVAAAPEEQSPLKRQISGLVKLSAAVAAVLFLLVGFVTYLNLPDHTFGERMIESILSGITLAMAMIPEEFPVVLTVFLSMGAWRLAKNKALVRKLPAVETLGAVSVLCVDKTGTITQNRMSVQQLWVANGNEIELCEITGLACETETYDPMEQAMLSHCEKLGIDRGHLFGGEMITEYAFTNELKMMGHVWQHDGEIIVAAKGSPERIFDLCTLSSKQRQTADSMAQGMSEQGLRVIAVGIMKPKTLEEIPANITQSTLTLSGLVGLEDPPRENVKEGIAACKQAGIRVVMITGDNGVTAQSIAQKVGMETDRGVITGNELDTMTDDELKVHVNAANIFARVVPAHKMRIVKALRDNGEVVAMTGDGVNDAPALKYADIGIAMGQRGSEVSREAADMILLDDNFSTIVQTVRDGRRIYDNIKKAVGYIFSIHIPIALSSLLAPMLGVDPVCLLLLPLHVVLLELMIDPTCSIVLERQPAESDLMQRTPRDPHAALIMPGMLIKSVLQGLLIFAASFGAYYVTLMQNLQNAPLARSMGIAILLLANLFLVQVNSSDHEAVTTTFKRLMHDKVMWTANIITVAVLIVALYTPLGGFLRLAPITIQQIGLVIALAVVSVFWVEILKWSKRRRGAKRKRV